MLLNIPSFASQKRHNEVNKSVMFSEKNIDNTTNMIIENLLIRIVNTLN